VVLPERLIGAAIAHRPRHGRPAVASTRRHALRLRRGRSGDRSAPHHKEGYGQMAEGAHIDLPAHEKTYARFINLFKYGAVACFFIAFLVIFIITR
jgi:hypothetical protein